MEYKPFIDFIKNTNATKETALKLLKDETSLTPEEKNLIFLYCFPRPLLDGELMIRIQKYREKNNITNLSLLPDFNETGLLIEAGRTEQYSRFIKHLMYSFGDVSKVAPVSYPYKSETKESLESPISKNLKTDNCAICGKDLFYLNDWTALVESNKNNTTFADDLSSESERKEFLAYGSKQSDVVLCKHCLIQLVNAIQIMSDIDPGFLDWTKRVTNNVNDAWDKLKLN